MKEPIIIDHEDEEVNKREQKESKGKKKIEKYRRKFLVRAFFKLKHSSSLLFFVFVLQQIATYPESPFTVCKRNIRCNRRQSQKHLFLFSSVSLSPLGRMMMVVEFWMCSCNCMSLNRHPIKPRRKREKVDGSPAQLMVEIRLL